MTDSPPEDHTPLRDGLEHDEEHETGPNWLSRIFLGIVGVALILLILTYWLPGSNIINILQGKIVSHKLDSNQTLHLNNGYSVQFGEAVIRQLNERFLSEQQHEFAVCLKGTADGKKYSIDGLYYPTIHSQSFTHVSSERCGVDTLIHLHTHPNDRCIFSDTDLNGYDSIRRQNPDAIIGLMCNVDRFNLHADFLLPAS